LSRKNIEGISIGEGSYSGPHFCHVDKTPLSRYKFNALLKKALAYLNIPLSRNIVIY
jgi:hypothetical protein